MQDASFLRQANIPIRENAELTPAAELSGQDRLTTDIVTGVVSNTLTCDLARRFAPPDIRIRTSAPSYAGFGLTDTRGRQQNTIFKR
jgi:hypothetical protein